MCEFDVGGLKSYSCVFVFLCLFRALVFFMNNSFLFCSSGWQCEHNCVSAWCIHKSFLASGSWIQENLREAIVPWCWTYFEVAQKFKSLLESSRSGQASKEEMDAIFSPITRLGKDALNIDSDVPADKLFSDHGRFLSKFTEILDVSGQQQLDPVVKDAISGHCQKSLVCSL